MVAARVLVAGALMASMNISIAEDGSGAVWRFHEHQNQDISDGKAPERTSHYEPFSILSSDEERVMKSAYLERVMMCKHTNDTMAETMDLLSNYMVISSGGDHSMAITRFAGLQGEKPAVIDLMVTKPDQILRYVAVNNQIVLSCRYPGL